MNGSKWDERVVKAAGWWLRMLVVTRGVAGDFAVRAWENVFFFEVENRFH
jgi:hypothetical protein